MPDVVKQIELMQGPLHETHKLLGAEMGIQDGWDVPASYGDVLFEYAAVREGGAGLIDLSARGRILVSGSEAVQFLNGLITNDMKSLAVNSWMAAAFPNVQGRLIASVRVIRLPDEGTGKAAGPAFLIDTEAATHERVLQTIERFTLAGDFRVRDMTEATALLTVQGRKAGDIVRVVLGDRASELDRNAACQWHASDSLGAQASCLLFAVNEGHLARGDHGRDARATSEPGCVTVIRATHTGEDGFDLIVESAQAAELWAALQTAGARPVGHDALEILRIEVGQPRYGVDMDETNVVTEAPLDDAVSFTKGCYIGQEIIARIKYRGHVAKKLSGVVFEGLAKVAVGAVIKSADDKEIGRVTSATYSPHLGRTLALGYLKYDYLAAETSVVVVSAAGELQGQVTELPFVKGA